MERAIHVRYDLNVTSCYKAILMKYTVIQAAKITGKSRQTIYRHIDAKPISVTQDDDGNQLIDASELIRVYGNDINFGALEEKGDKSETVAKPENVTPAQQDVTPSNDTSLKVMELTTKLEVMKEQLNSKDNETEFLKKLLEEEKAERKAANNLLEDHQGKESKWDQQFRAIEQRLANQEKQAKERAENEEKLLNENKRIKQAYSKQKKALDAEKNKGFFQKLFG